MTDAAVSDEGEARRRGALAEQLEAGGRAEDAFAAWRDSVRHAPNLPEGYVGAARILLGRGDFGQAAQVLSRGLAAVGPENADSITPPLAALLAGLVPDAWHERLDHDLTACLTSPAVNPQTLAKAAARLLLLKGGEAPDPADPLWLAFLTGCINVDASMEARLTALRRDALERGEGAAWAEALATQAAAGEYLWPVSPAERDALDRLGDAPGAAVLRSMYEGPDREAPGAGLDAVRRQYEENPYPRWRSPPAPQPRSLRSVVEGLARADIGLLSPAPLTVLVAGCGTGYEPIELARMDPSLTITAIDLSLASLDYAEKMAGELGVDAVTFMQGDLLKVGALRRTFDVITSTGVLHHLERPAEGLHALTRVLAPGGVMRLGLYSERARGLVKLAHVEIAARGLTTSADDIRAFRRHVLGLPAGAPLAALTDSEDFYSVSGCRDLLFHAREHRYTPLQLGELLAGEGLRLVGFEASPEARARFEEAFGARADTLDLSLWDRLERAHPTLFAGMYHLWCQRGEPA